MMFFHKWHFVITSWIFVNLDLPLRNRLAKYGLCEPFTFKSSFELYDDSGNLNPQFMNF